MSKTQEKLNLQLFNVVADEKVSDEARLKKVKYLVRLGADVNTRLYGRSVLSKAIENGAGAEVQEFLREKGANEWVIPKEEAENLAKKFWDDREGLKSKEDIEKFIKEGADVNAKDVHGRGTPLVMASRDGDLAMVQFLIENGAKVDFDFHGNTELTMAIASGYLEVAEVLVQNGANPNAKGCLGETALRKGVNKGYVDLVKYMIEKGGDVNEKSEGGWTALMKASSEGNIEMVKLLLENGADVNAKNDCGDTALMNASYLGHSNVVNLLLENGADVNVANIHNQTALTNAYYFGHKEVVKLIKNHIKKQKEENAKKINVDGVNENNGGFLSKIFGGFER